ncbi:calmodulin-lysine N-methyltransferase [Prorops nasuta]|uniref:calmodulin-lysine N-methyltransferase n=1 Tax=Prorops nasuta TaxID=863751 RepID=UPI0034CE9A20
MTTEETVVCQKGESMVKRDVRKYMSRTQESVTTAKKRWKILAKALVGSMESDSGDEKEDEISVRRFTSFGLLTSFPLERNLDTDSIWQEYSVVLKDRVFSIEIRKIDKCFTANELIGFNNTGNVCVWPSEECLAYYLLKNPRICKEKRVLELGGGMSCLAGLFAAKYCDPSFVTLTDGNVTSVDNVRCIVLRNNMSDLVRCGVVQWARAARALRLAALNDNRNQSWMTKREWECIIYNDLYDVILCADCLFFDETRLDLVETIYGWLADNGVALILAPRRGTTFDKFAEAAINRGFFVRQTECYDSDVWTRHLDLLNNRHREYSPDLHYPLLLELTKQPYQTPTG